MPHPRTKHVDVRGNFVAEYQEKGVIKILFVDSESNNTDNMTKNLGSELHTKHVTRLIGE